MNETHYTCPGCGQPIVAVRDAEPETTDTGGLVMRLHVQIEHVQQDALCQWIMESLRDDMVAALSATVTAARQQIMAHLADRRQDTPSVPYRLPTWAEGQARERDLAGRTHARCVTCTWDEETGATSESEHRVRYPSHLIVNALR